MQTKPLTKLITLSLIASCFLVNSIFAQNDLSKPENIFLAKALLKDTISKVNLTFTGGYSINTNSVNSEQMSDFIYASSIDENDKENLLKTVNSTNLFGYGADGGITAKFRKSKKWNYRIGLYYKDLASVSFNKTLANIALNGNKMYAGKSVNFGPCNITYLTYQQLYLGAERNIGKSTVGFGISLLNGTNFKQMNVKRAQLFTESEGQYIDLDTDFEVKYNDNSNISNGLGMSASLSYKYLDEKNNFIFNVSDLGFIKWNSLLTYGTNKQYHFDGIAITDIFNFDESAFSNVNLSSVQSILDITATNQNHVIATPATISADYLRSFGKLGIGTGAKYMLFINYNPKLYGRLSYDLSENWWSAATISYGGFGGFDYELAIGGQIKNKLYISINMHYAEWLISPSNTSGQGINLVVSKNL